MLVGGQFYSLCTDLVKGPAQIPGGMVCACANVCASLCVCTWYCNCPFLLVVEERSSTLRAALGSFKLFLV